MLTHATSPKVRGFVCAQGVVVLLSKNQQDVVSKQRFVSNGLLVSHKAILKDKTQARTTLLRGRIPGRSLTEENVGDCVVGLPSKSKQNL